MDFGIVVMFPIGSLGSAIRSPLPLFPWLRCPRFSLRTLLIATTLVAVVLGIIVWMSRAG